MEFWDDRRGVIGGMASIVVVVRSGVVLLLRDVLLRYMILSSWERNLWIGEGK